MVKASIISTRERYSSKTYPSWQATLVLALLVSLGGGAVAQGQTRSASYYQHSLSLVLENGSSPEGQRYYFSTYDGVLTWARQENGYYSGELRPGSLYSTMYYSDYDGYHPAVGYYGYGTLTMTLTSGDSDQDSLPDFLDLRKSASQSISGTVTEHQVGGGTMTLSIGGSLSRNANAYRGNYSITSSEGVSVSGTFKVMGTQGTLTYNPAARTFSLSGVQFDGGTTVSGSGTYQIINQDQISVPAFKMTNNSGGIVTVQAMTLNRRGSVYYARFTMSDGNTFTSWVDYEYNHILIIDNNDTDGDGIPDLSDTTNMTLPVITQGPQSLTAVAGQTVTFTVSVSGTGPFTYQWYKDGVAIAGAAASSYIINGVGAVHQGSYTVQVGNQGGTVTSAPATLTVLMPPQVTNTLANVTVEVGQPASFSVAAMGTPPLSYQWYKDGLPLAGATAASLQIASVRLEDGGRYWVVVSNAAGTAQSAEALLIVRAPPVIVAQPSSLGLVRGMPLHLQVGAQGGVPLTFIWLKNGQLLGEAQGSNYQVAAVELAHAGAYQVVVTNAFGKATSQVAQVTVLPHGEAARFAVALAATQGYTGEPMGVSVVALDAWNNPVLNYQGTGAFRLQGMTMVSTSLLGQVNHSASLNAGGMTLGYAFTPNANLRVTHVRHYGGARVSLWTQGGSLLASQEVVSQNGTWRVTELAQPVVLTAGQTYRVGVYIASGQGYYRSDMGGTFTFGSINGAYLGSGNVFPNVAASNLRWPMVDLVVEGEKQADVPFALEMPASFQAGRWEGFLRVLQPGNALRLRYEDTAQHVGESEVFAVVTPLRFHSALTPQERQRVRVEGFRLRLTLPPQRNCVVQYSEDLRTWQRWTNFTPTNSFVELLDPASVGRARRFYRAVLE